MIHVLFIELWYSVMNLRISGVQLIMLFFKCFTSVSTYCVRVKRWQHSTQLCKYIFVLHIFIKFFSLLGKKKKRETIAQIHWRLLSAEIQFNAQALCTELSCFYCIIIFLLDSYLSTDFTLWQSHSVGLLFITCLCFCCRLDISPIN